MASKKAQLETHPLVAKLGIDPNSPGDLHPIIGYLGPSSRPGHWRLYESRDFSSFTDIPEEAIAYNEAQLPGDANGPTIVYVRGGARIHVTRVETHTLGGRYLAGRIARENLGGAPGPRDQDAIPYAATCTPTNCATCNNH
jgi:acetyl esterase/lipase